MMRAMRAESFAWYGALTLTAMSAQVTTGVRRCGMVSRTGIKFGPPGRQGGTPARCGCKEPAAALVNWAAPKRAADRCLV